MFEERSSWTSRKELLDGSTNSAYAGGGPEPPARSTVTASQTRAPSTSTGTAAALAAPAVPALIQPLRVAASRSWSVPARANTAATVRGGRAGRRRRPRRGRGLDYGRRRGRPLAVVVSLPWEKPW